MSSVGRLWSRKAACWPAATPAKGVWRSRQRIETAVEALLLANRPDGELPLKGLAVLVTAGPTQEPLDPVRFLTNHSTGKMGYALAEQHAIWARR